MPIIEMDAVTKDYGRNRGIFDLSLTVNQGEVYGFVGINGAGKTTTIRHMMGFLRPGRGHCIIKGMDAWKDAAKIMKHVGYVPGEIAFPAAPTGTEFLRRQAELQGVKDMSFANQLIDILQLDPTANLKRMSKGMKQKTAIVAALMADPEILILDEPTTGLDPLMRVSFIELLNEEKKKGKTIFMSTHLFEEVENTCDTVALIKDGSIFATKATREIRHNEDKQFKIEFLSREGYMLYCMNDYDFVQKRDDQYQVIVNVNDAHINTFMDELSMYRIKFIRENKYSLEQYFNEMHGKSLDQEGGDNV